MSHLRKFWAIHSHKDILLFSSKSFIGFVLTLDLWSILSLFLCMVWRKDPSSFFYMWLSSCSSTICWKDHSFLFSWLSYHQPIDHKHKRSFLDSQFFSVCRCAIRIPVPHYSDYCCFVLSFEIEKYESSSFVLLFLRLAILSPLSSLIHFRISLSISSTQAAEMFHWDCIESIGQFVHMHF